MGATLLMSKPAFLRTDLRIIANTIFNIICTPHTKQPDSYGTKYDSMVSEVLDAFSLVTSHTGKRRVHERHPMAEYEGTEQHRSALAKDHRL
jgi:hypothetical protein